MVDDNKELESNERNPYILLAHCCCAIFFFSELCFTKNPYSSVKDEVTKVVPIAETALFFTAAILCDVACICMRLLCLWTVLMQIWHCHICFSCWIFTLWPSVQPSAAYLTELCVQFRLGAYCTWSLSFVVWAPLKTKARSNKSITLVHLWHIFTRRSLCALALSDRILVKCSDARLGQAAETIAMTRVAFKTRYHILVPTCCNGWVSVALCCWLLVCGFETYWRQPLLMRVKCKKARIYLHLGIHERTQGSQN